MKKMTLLEAVEYIENHEDENFAFRGDDYIPVKKFRPSRYHGDDPVKNKSIGGVCAIGVSSSGNDRKQIIARACLARYYGENVFLLKYERSGCGEDNFEYILSDHQIIGLIGAENFIQVGSIGFDGAFDSVTEIPERIEVREEVVMEKLSFEDWCMKTFKKLHPRIGIFADQYDFCLKRGINAR